MLASGPAAAGILCVPAPDCAPAFQTLPDGEHITAPDYGNVFSPGDPALPFKDVRVILPPSTSAASVSVGLVGDTREAFPSGGEVAPAPPMVTEVDGRQVRDWGRGKQIESGRNVLVYGKDAFYPARNVEVVDVGNLRKWRIATIRYHPFRYNPVTRVLERTSGGQISVSYGGAVSVNMAATRLLADNVFSDKARSLAANYSEAQAWYSAQQPSGIVTSQQSQSTANYVIITTSAIVSASTKLQAFVNHKISRGFAVEVDTEAQWGGGAGDTAANNIRAFLKANYVSKGIEYVLLIGNPTPSTGNVPMKMLWPRYGALADQEAPSDYFYADLTGNWDLNGNGFFGEEVGDFGPGGVDRFPEVIVGRIPFYGNFTELDSILAKTINYESGALNGPWRRNVLLSMKPSDASTPGYQLGEAIKNAAAVPAGMTTTRLYDSDYGLSPPPEYTSCTYANVLSAWQQHAGFHFWWTHGNETLAAEVFSTDRCQYLDDNYPSFTFQCSCSNGYPERTDNLGYALLKQGAIAVDSATRVSWYYPGETVFTNTDSNAGMTYNYAVDLVANRMPCGDAHFAMMLEVPKAIWMNHCVFNLYGDPSVQYPWPPLISHTPLGDTDITSQPYPVQANVTTTSPMAPGSPKLYWNTTGAGSFTTATMALISGTTYAGSIPAQAYGTTVYYYIEATDAGGQTSTVPLDAPESLLSFEVRQDTQSPLITHTPLSDTGNKFGPYPVVATVTDDLGVRSATLHYRVNGGPYSNLSMLPQANDNYQADIPGPTMPGDTISYYITATDISLASKTSRLPATGSYSFSITQKICVAVFNSADNPSYFVGVNVNAWSPVSDILNSDPTHRFQVSVLTSLKTGPGSIGIEGQDVLVLPDNAVPMDSLQTVADWFVPGKVILTLDSATCYASYTGWMWPASVGTYGGNVYWDNSSGTGDQKIWLADPITAGYLVGQVIGSVQYDAQFYVNKLPADARALAGKSSNSNRCYAVCRDVPARGRLVMLGPYVTPLENQYSMIREALIAPPLPRSIRIVAPNGGESYQAGDYVTITCSASGVWGGADKVKLEYFTGLDTVWRQIPGAQSLAYGFGSFAWNTTGLPGSHGYRVRASSVDAAVSDYSDAPFSIIPTVSIAAAKSIADRMIVRLAGKLVTSAVVGLTYVEEPDRGAGIQLTSTQGLYPSALVNVVGTMGTLGGERVLDADTTQTLGTGSRIRPYALKTGALGGGGFGLQLPVMEYRLVKESDQWVPTIVPATGLNNIGLLVRVCGRVTLSGTGWFYIDDGSRCYDGSGTVGVKVLCPGLTAPDAGQYVLMNAISSTYFDGDNLFRALVLPDQDSLQPLPE